MIKSYHCGYYEQRAVIEGIIGDEMNIYFSRSEYGIYECGGVLDKPFTHLCEILSERFQTENIVFGYQEIEIQLTLFSPKVKEARYREWYAKLPIYHRGKNKVSVLLPVTEREKTVADIFALLGKAFDILIAKKKKHDLFDGQKITSVLLALEQELQKSDIWELHRQYEALMRKKILEWNRQGRLERERTCSEKKRLIYDIRLYYHFDKINERNRYFSPYGKELCDKILGKLRIKKFRLPGYTHLYIMASDSFENALFYAQRLENWQVTALRLWRTISAMQRQMKPEKNGLFLI